MSVRKSSLALCLAGLGALLIGLLFVHAWLQRQADLPLIDHMATVVADLELTDLALFTEARYTRHASQADLHSAFQDHPLAVDAGALLEAVEREDMLRSWVLVGAATNARLDPAPRGRTWE